MGCHTWYRRLVTNDQEQVVRIVKETIALFKEYDWYEFTSLADLFENIDERVVQIADHVFESIDELFEVNGVWGIYTGVYKYNIDAPRIGGYPEDIITSADQMFNAMETGLYNWQGEHFDFYWDKECEDAIRKNITDFFDEYPDGIIYFG